MPTMSPAKTKRHVVIAADKNNRLRIKSVHADHGRALDAWERLDDERIAARAEGLPHYAWIAVREDDHEYVAKAVADLKLTPRQREALTSLVSVLPRPGMTIRPGYEYQRWYGAGQRMETSTLARHARPRPPGGRSPGELDMRYHQPIPAAVLAKMPELIASVTDAPTAISLASFPDNDGEVTLYGLDVSYAPRIVRVKDKRRDDYIIATRHEFYMSSDGTVDSTMTDRYHRLSSISGGGFPEVSEEEIAEEKAAERRETILNSMGIER
jgi:hypothetical protein